ncbi:MAG: hypothetical protein SGJ00_00430 [bacterium]|nr:hypothetical protein [bacterium]
MSFIISLVQTEKKKYCIPYFDQLGRKISLHTKKNELIWADNLDRG